MKKIKLLCVSDDIRNLSGVGVQCRKLLTGLNRTGMYDIVEIAGSLIQQSPSPIMFDGIKLYPTSDGYGNQMLLRTVMKAEKPDIVLAFSDPRFFEYLFLMDDEIRSQSKLIFYHTWDNEPFPKFNLPWYSACDRIVMLSKFSYELMSQNGVTCDCIQHGMDPSEFYPLPEDIIKRERQNIIQQTRNSNIDFIVLWNNRNMIRKRPGDVISAFKIFAKKYPNSLLLMHTNPIDPEGANIKNIIEDVNPSTSPIMISSAKVSSEQLNLFYNIANVSINISFAEGFGLCVAESLCAGTPVIATKTGGMTEQLTNGTSTFGHLLEPVVKTMYGNLASPYIYGDYVSIDQVVKSLTYARENIFKFSQLGLQGRDHIIRNFHIDSTVNKWHNLLQEEVLKSSSYLRYKFI